MKIPANETPIAAVSGWTSWRNFSVESDQQSVPVYLQGGQRYYLEALMEQGSGHYKFDGAVAVAQRHHRIAARHRQRCGMPLHPFTGLTNLPGIHSSGCYEHGRSRKPEPPRSPCW